MEIQNCDKDSGIACEAYVTNYRIGGVTPDFKSTVRTNKNPRDDTQKLTRELEMCYQYKNNEAMFKTCHETLFDNCMKKRIRTVDASEDAIEKATKTCEKMFKGKVFSSAFQDYILSLPDYTTQSLNYSNYRIIIQIKHKKDSNNYYSFATMEVNR